MGRIVGIDYGSKRIGVAISDDLKMIASPLETVHSKDIFEFIKNLIANSSIETIVVGVPINLDGNETHGTAPAKEFISALKRKFPSVKVLEADERFTSKMAGQSLISAGAKLKHRRDKSILDKVSAAIILQSFLDANAFK